jgi:hypothetical protein
LATRKKRTIKAGKIETPNQTLVDNTDKELLDKVDEADKVDETENVANIPIEVIMGSTTPSAALTCDTFSYGDNSTLGSRWETWLERIDIYLTATGLTDAAKTKACFLHHIGSEVYDIFKTLRKIDNTDTYKEAHEKLTSHFVFKRSEFAEDQT